MLKHLPMQHELKSQDCSVFDTLVPLLPSQAEHSYRGEISDVVTSQALLVFLLYKYLLMSINVGLDVVVTPLVVVYPSGLLSLVGEIS